MTVYSLLLVEATAGAGTLVSGTWIQDHVGTLETAILAAKATEKANGGRIKVAVVEKIESRYDSTTRGELCE